MDRLFSVLLAGLPALPLAAGISARQCGPRRAGRITGWAAVGAALIATALAARLLTGAGRIAPGPDRVQPTALGGLLGLDAVSAAMSLLVSFLGAVVVGFSRNYLAGEPGQARFLSWLSLALGSVLAFALSWNLLVLLAAWIATSCCLHRLLLFYPGRAGAVSSARKKFVFSRLGEACLLAAALILHSHHGTFEVGSILADVERGDTGGVAPCAMLLASCAVLKSAQFPFHSWLPDTMETPTPVSAFMHAGVVNAGGFLILRFAPLFAAAPLASGLLALIGAFTAAFGAIVMLAQPTVKRALAYSTIAQMGFMFAECGVGAYALAALHMAAHALYKAHAFLTSGSTIGAAPRTAVRLWPAELVAGTLAGSLVVVLGAAGLRHLLPSGPAEPLICGVVLWLALAYGIACRMAERGERGALAQTLAAAVAVAVLSLCLHAAASALFGPLPVPRLPRALTGTVIAVFVGLFVFQALLGRAPAYPPARRLYVHALNGFYVGVCWDRLLARRVPIPTSPSRLVPLHPNGSSL